MRILGCWYSNNGVDNKIIQSSLNSIKTARDNYKDVNIVTCNWAHISDNPFEEYITIHPMGVHLGIILQILNVLHQKVI